MTERAVLIVDDEHSILDLLARLLKQQGFTPYCTTSGSSALEVLAQQTIPVILTDLRMPEMDGIEFCKRAKALDPNAIVFAVSAYVNAFSEATFNDAGFAGVFSKPFDTKPLMDTCTKAFESIDVPPSSP